MGKRRVVSTSRRPRARWAEVVDDLKRSGLPVSRYAAEHGLSARTLAWWRWALKAAPRVPQRVRSDAQRAAPVVSFVPVELVPDRVTGPPVGADLWVLLAGNRRIEVGAGFDGETLGRLVLVLEELAC